MRRKKEDYESRIIHIVGIRIRYIEEIMRKRNQKGCCIYIVRKRVW